jgi:muramoyltetrapeptide carboxypeptidase
MVDFTRSAGVLPPSLNPGDIIRVVSPAGPADRHLVASGIAKLQDWGYKVELSKHALDRSGFLAGEDDGRLSDLLEALTDSNVKGIVCTRGGYGSGRLLDKIPWEQISGQDPKLFIGFSDIGALQIALYNRCGWVSLSGPQVAHGLSGAATSRSAEQLRGFIDGTHRELKWRDESELRLDPLRTGSARGILIPCCLSILISLLDTPYFPNLDRALLCLEDINEADYRIDRMIWQLKASGRLDNISGLILGKFILNGVDICPVAANSVLHFYSDHSFPIWRGISYGHVDECLTLPIGAEVEIDADNRMQLIQS